MRTWLLLIVSATICRAGLAADKEPASTQVSSAVAREVVEMFAAGFGRGTNPLKDAKQHYDAARAAANGDPRVEYAFGLVLLKQLRNKEAIAQFQQVTKSQPEFWLGWQALVWCHFVGKDYTLGHERLKEFAQRLADSKSDLAERQKSAEWIGQVIAAVQKSADTVKQRETLVREGEALKEIVGADLQASVEKGRAIVQTLYSLLEEDLQQTRELVQAKQEKERAEKGTQVAKNLEASAEKREALKKTAEEWKKYLDQELAGYNKQLTQLESEYGVMQKRANAISTMQIQANTQMALADQQASANSKNSSLAQVYEQRKASLEVQLLKSQVEMDQVMVATAMIAQNAQAVVGQRTAAIQKFERATGQLVQKDASLDKWQDRLKKEGDKLKAPPKGKPAPVANKIQQARTFRTYVDLDLVLERERLLTSIGVASSDAAE